MIKTLRKIGNSNALILDKPILELLGLQEGAQVQLTIQDGSLIISPVQAERVSSEVFEEKLEYVMRKRDSLLKRLAE